MKKTFTLLLLLLSSISLLFAQENNTSTENTLSEVTIQLPEPVMQVELEDPTRPKLILPKFTLVMDEGVSYCQITRIEKQKNRSNFVRETMMLGGYYNLQTVDLSFFDLFFDISAYYPIYNAFNGMKQNPHHMFNYGISSIIGTTVTYKKLKMINITSTLGMHYMYQLTDEWHMHYLGLGLILGLELPVTNKWTIINNNLVTLDNANLGKNKNIQPFDGCYSYHIDLGIRYSPKSLNKYYYINTFKHDQKVAARKSQKTEKKEAKKQQNLPEIQNTSSNSENISANQLSEISEPEKEKVEENSKDVENVSIDEQKDSDENQN